MTSLQKKLAARIMKCGVNRVWINPKNDKVRQAITRSDVRRFIDDGIIKKLPVKKKTKKPAKRQQKTGSKKGAKGARIGKKTEWLKIIRPQRKMLREMKKDLKPLIYRKLYKMVKGGNFRSRHHLMSYIKEKDYLKVKKK